MKMPNVLRLGRVELKVLDLDKSVEYYTKVIGLEVTGRVGDSVYLKAWDEYDHHSVILTKSNSAGVAHIAFKVESESDLAYFEKQVERFGCTTTRISNRTRLAEGEAVRFILPTGQHCELYYEIEYVGTAVGTLNPHPWPLETVGIAPHRIEHCLLTGDDLKTATRFFVEALNFKQSERITTVDQEELIATFLFTSNKAHDIAFVKGPDEKFHHVGFEVDDVNAVFRAADILSMYEVPFDVTPTRHGVTRGQTVYFYDPSGNRNEAFAGGNVAYRDMKVITWTEDRIGQGVFYHRRELSESFLKALT
jgi:catechol 2,3-dioxygenase